MIAATYRIEDEPEPGTLAQFAVHPLWPLLSLMLAGAWLAWPWFVLNGFAVGCPSRWREVAWAVAGVVGSAVIGMGILALELAGLLNDKSAIQYAILLLVVWKLGVGYALFALQSRTIELYRHYGGKVRSGLVLLVVAVFFLNSAVMHAVSIPLWTMVMS